jgi:hypothetical protein
MGLFSKRDRDPQPPATSVNPRIKDLLHDPRAAYVEGDDLDLRRLVGEVFAGAWTGEVMLLAQDFELSGDAFYAQAGLAAAWDGQPREAREAAYVASVGELDALPEDVADDADGLQRWAVLVTKAEILAFALDALYGTQHTAELGDPSNR